MFCGAAVRGRVDISKQALPSVRQIFSEFLVDSSGRHDKLLDFLSLAFKGISMRVKLTENETYEMMKNLFGDKPLPDAADLVDELGMMISHLRLIEYYDNVPYIREFVDAIREYAKANIEFGVTYEKATASISFQTEGVKETFDLIMAGMTDAK